MNDTGRLELRQVQKRFTLHDQTVQVLEDVTFSLQPGEAVAVTGPSGSGKSTLLHLIGTLDRPSGGTILYDGKDPWQRSEGELARFRNRAIGFVFQDAYLLPQYSVIENVVLPSLAFPATRSRPAEETARDLLARVGLEHRLTHKPAELSGGERQRAAVARALINSPGLLLCDEPTGSLDRANAEAVGELLLELHGEQSIQLIVVTHSEELARRFGRRLRLEEGRCSEA